MFFSVKNAICLSLRANMLNDPLATTFSPPENQLNSPSVKLFGLFEHCGLILELWRNYVVWWFFCLALALNSQSHVISEACGAPVVAACCAGRQLIQMKGMWTLKPIKCLGKLLASLGTSSLCISTNWCLLPASLWGVSWHIEYTHISVVADADTKTNAHHKACLLLFLLMSILIPHPVSFSTALHQCAVDFENQKLIKKNPVLVFFSDTCPLMGWLCCQIFLFNCHPVGLAVCCDLITTLFG